MKCDNQLLRPLLKVCGYCFFAAAVLACGGGGGGDDPVPEPEPQPEPQAQLEVKPERVEAAAGGGTYTVSVTATAAWTAACDSTWCGVSTAKEAVTLKVAANPRASQRQTVVKVTMGSLNRTVTVVQAAGSGPAPAEQLEVGQQEFNIPYKSGDYTVTVTANVDWTAASDRNWCTVARQGDVLKIQVGLNEEETMRPAVITVRGGTLARTVRVEQAGITARGRDSLVLVALAAATGGDTWKNPWNTTEDLTHWNGVRLDARGERVEELVLRSNRVTGPFPADIVKLDGLKKLDLGNNGLEGNLPADLNRLMDLEYLAVDSCRLEGSLPQGITALTKLRILDLGFNAFSGTLPGGLSSLTGLVWLRLAGNRWGGRLPESWKSLRKLTVLDVSLNEAEGNIPAAWLTALLNTEYLYLHGNRLEGEIPVTVVNLYSLRSLALDNNNFTGSIPAELGLLPELEGLWLYNNRLSGEIPASLLGNTHWPQWQPFVCPQQGDGFSGGCGPAVRSAAYSGRYPLPDKNSFY